MRRDHPARCRFVSSRSPRLAPDLPSRHRWASSEVPSSNAKTNDRVTFVRPCYKRLAKAADLQGYLLQGVGHVWAIANRVRAHTDNTTCSLAGTSLSGSDGTRTRDLRRDRPAF